MDCIKLSGGLPKLAQLAGVDLPDWVVSEVEGLVLLFVGLESQTTVQGAVANIMMWVKTHFKQSLIKSVSDYLVGLLDGPKKQGPLLDDTPNWLKLLKEARTNWHNCVHAEAFAQISRLLGLLVTLGLCKASSVEFSIGEFKIFAPRLQTKHASAFDLIDATVETTLFFIEGGYLCFKTKSIQPLLVSDHSALQLDTAYAGIMSDWDLVRCGNLMKVKGELDIDFGRRLNIISDEFKRLTSTLTGLDKKLVGDKYYKILILQNDYVTFKISSGIRRAPFALLFFGPSSQGKTTAGEQSATALLMSQDLDTDLTRRATVNAGDRFMSTWTSDKLVMKIDDMCNDKSDFVEQSPTRLVLDVVNNECVYANKADLGDKGKCLIEPPLVVATTNKKNLDAGMYSNCPYSIQRRFITITCRARTEFQKKHAGKKCGLDSTFVYEWKEKVGYEEAVDDVWEFDVELAIEPDNLAHVAKYGFVTHNGKKLKGIGMFELLDYLIYAFDIHCKVQNKIVEDAANRLKNMERCGVDGCINIKGICLKHDKLKVYEIPKRQFGGKIVNAVKGLVRPRLPTSAMEVLIDRAEAKVAEAVYKYGKKFVDDFDWVTILPTSIVKPFMEAEKGTWKHSVVQWLYADVIDGDYRQRERAFRAICIFIPIYVYFADLEICETKLFGFHLVGACFLMYLFYIKLIKAKVEKDLREYLLDVNFEVEPIIKSVRDDTVKYVCYASAALGSLYVVACLIRKHYSEIKSQGSLAPRTRAEVEARDNQTNVWSSVVTRSLPISRISKCVTPKVLGGLVSKNLLCFTTEMPSGRLGQMNCLFIKSNVVLVPSHIFDEAGPSLPCSFFKENAYANGGKFAGRLELATSVILKDKDLALCYCPTGGSFRDITKHFPLEDITSSVNFHMSYRHNDGRLEENEGVGSPGVVEVEGSVYRAFGYQKLTRNTFNGLCGAVLHSETNGSVIIGMHTAGVEDTPEGYSCMVNQKELLEGFVVLKQKEGVLLIGTAEKFEKQIFGKEILNEKALPHKKSPLNYLPKESQIEYYGSCPGITTSKTNVRVTPISEHIIEVCGVPNIYRGPEMKPEWKGYQDCLANMSIPAVPYQYEVLELAIKDYKRGLNDIFKSDLWRDARPLTDLENCSGIPSCKFIDAIKLSTAIGYPLSGEKRKFVYEIETQEDLLNYYSEVGFGSPTDQEMQRLEDVSNRVVKFVPEIYDEIDRCEACYAAGERAYTIAKACKKDEILPKKKCRIFYSNPIALTYLIRKYYLPLLRVLQMNPLDSECAVGINSHGPEWDEFYEHVTKHGMHRLIGGDYGKYDQKIPSQMIIAALRILIDFAKLCDYTQKDLDIMEAMVGDIAYAVIAFNGDLIGLTEGTHISGNSLTVIINGIVGSLNLRCYYFDNLAHRGTNFRDNVALMTYGDDNIGSVSETISDFTIKGISEYLGEYGQIYTMPDKESELLDFLPAEQFEFLKRKSVYHPDLDCEVGALVDKSIFKSLHCFMRDSGSPDTEEVAAAKNVDTALSEWFNHGREVYEKRRQEMKEVAHRAGITGFCKELETSYDARVERWIDNYKDEPRLKGRKIKLPDKPLDPEA
jgi:hypothetical protein